MKRNQLYIYGVCGALHTGCSWEGGTTVHPWCLWSLAYWLQLGRRYHCTSMVFVEPHTLVAVGSYCNLLRREHVPSVLNHFLQTSSLFHEVYTRTELSHKTSITCTDLFVVFCMCTDGCSLYCTDRHSLCCIDRHSLCCIDGYNLYCIDGYSLCHIDGYNLCCIDGYSLCCIDGYSLCCIDGYSLCCLDGWSLLSWVGASV